MRNLAIVALFFLNHACNGLFYYPDDVVYTDPGLVGQPYESFSIPGRDGETLSGWYLPTPWERHGVALHFHGNAQNMTAHLLFTFWLLDAGYDLVIFDYRGYGKSSGTPSRLGVVNDGLDILAHVSKTYHREGEDFVVIGQSLGGAIAIPALALWKGRSPDALVLDSTFTSYREIARDKLAGIWLTWPFQWPLSFLVSDDLSPIDFAAQVRLPLVMMHGTNDDVTPLRFARSLFEALGSRDKDLWVLPGGTHTSGLFEGSPYRERLLKFFCNASIQPDLCNYNRRKFKKRYERRKAAAEANTTKKATSNRNIP